MSEPLTTDIQRQRDQVDELNARAYEERYNNTELTLKLGLDALEKARAIKYRLGQAWALRNIGIAYAISGRPDAAEAYFQEAYALFERLENMRGIALTLSNLATIYHQLGRLDKAIEFHVRALRYLQLIPDLVAFYAQTLANLGSLYGELEQYELAIDYHQKALALHQEQGNKRGVFFSMVILGSLYQAIKEYHRSEEALNQALDIASELGEEDLAVRALIGRAQLLKEQERSEEALTYLQKAEEIASTIQNPQLLVNIHLAMADAHLSLGLLDKAQESIRRVSEGATRVKVGSIDYYLPEIQSRLSEMVGDYETAYKQYKEYTKRYLALQRAATRNTLAAVDKILREDILGAEKEAQADLIVARRIQEALLHGEAELREVFPESIYWLLPRGIVSGDFLWVGKGKDGSRILVVADASGAGVSAAMLSTIAHTLLYEIITIRGVTDPGRILSQLHKGLLDLLYPPTKLSSAELETIQSEGLQVGVCALLSAASELHYAGAQIPLWVYNPMLGWEQLAPDKRLIGQKIEGEKTARLYTSTIIPVERHWVLLFLTDGWERQVRASDGKRYGRTAVREFLAKNPPQDLTEWAAAIRDEFNHWREGAAPTDDVLLAAVRL
ncbi:MAG: tetratricopeptide repeat protein [Bacteroidia bacterium]|nr:tetratricopeptide repeat protein [Bacteroidia bacterium]MDW8015561.1 tetratricopeptide repeat protein [Bacteroidia bacterium]